MNTSFIAIACALTTGLTALQATAQVAGQPYSALKTLGGYEPSVLPSEADALALYKSMPTDIFRAKSQCHQRAHHWAWSFWESRQLKTMKIFLFFTDRYNNEFDYNWDYHVAPLIPVRLADGTVQEQVFDPTFTSMPATEDPANADRYDNKPVSVRDWIQYFVLPDTECPVIENYEDFKNYQTRYYCYVLKAPMYAYIPRNFEKETEVRDDWWEGDLLEMKNSLNH